MPPRDLEKRRAGGHLADDHVCLTHFFALSF
jgi:hypothetical protein